MVAKFVKEEGVEEVAIGNVVIMLFLRHFFLCAKARWKTLSESFLWNVHLLNSVTLARSYEHFRLWPSLPHGSSNTR